VRGGGWSVGGRVGGGEWCGGQKEVVSKGAGGKGRRCYGGGVKKGQKGEGRGTPVWSIWGGGLQMSMRKKVGPGGQRRSKGEWGH